MARRISKEPKLTARQGKVLRFVVTRFQGEHSQLVNPADVWNKIEWSDLPHNVIQAKATLQQLQSKSLVIITNNGTMPSQEGIDLIAQADKAGWWK